MTNLLIFGQCVICLLPIAITLACVVTAIAAWLSDDDNEDNE